MGQKTSANSDISALLIIFNFSVFFPKSDDL